MSARLIRILVISFLVHCYFGCRPSDDVPQGAFGGYGFLSEFQAMPEHEARQKIADMFALGIKEFQFYDWFADYSTPFLGACWPDPFFRVRENCRKTIEIYIDEIKRRNGRSWAYVQAVGSQETNLAEAIPGVFKLIDKDGQWHWHEKKFPTYFANAAWANYMVETWAPAIAELGFTGVHWDTLGARAQNYGAEKEGFAAFLRTAKTKLAHHGLKQTANFVSLAWWDDVLISQVLEFPYSEVWSRDEELAYFKQMGGDAFANLWGVIVFYPPKKVPPGSSHSATILSRFHEARQNHLHYAVIANGKRRLVSEYVSVTEPLPEDDILLQWLRTARFH